MSKANIQIVLGVVIAIALLVQLGFTIMDGLENQKHCAEFANRVKASRTEHIKKLGCVAIMPDGSVLAEPKK